MKGLANIPLLIAIVAILGITPFALKLVQQNQNTENRAAYNTKYIPCAQLTLARSKYCLSNNKNQSTSPNGIPCAQLISAINQYCRSSRADELN